MVNSSFHFFAINHFCGSLFNVDILLCFSLPCCLQMKTHVEVVIMFLVQLWCLITFFDFVLCSKFHLENKVEEDLLSRCANEDDVKSFTITDTYFDSSELSLTAHDIWLRVRNNTLEMKWSENKSVGKSVLTTQYNETEDVSIIAESDRKDCTWCVCANAGEA